MKNLLRIAILSLIIFYSCVSVRFPETIKVDITIPSDFDIDKMQILIDTLKGLNKKYPQITVVQRKASDKGPSFGEQFHTDSIYTKKPPRFTMLLSKLVPKKGKANTEFCSQYYAFKDLTENMKRKLLNLKGVYSSEGPISITTKERVKEKGKKIKELKSTHKIIRKISTNYAIYSSPGHLVGFQPKVKKASDLKKKLFKHQIKKKFQHSLEWEKIN